MRRTWRAIGAAVLLLALVVGVPTLLVLAVGNPWPGRAAIEMSDTRTLTISALAVATWVVWGRFVIAATLEAVEQVQHAHHRPAGGGRQPMGFAPPPISGTASGVLAHRLIAAAIVLLPMARSMAPLPADPPVLPDRPAASVAAPTEGSELRGSAPVASLEPSSSRQTSAVEVVAEPGDTLVGIAVRYLGDGSRWREIFDLNREVAQSDGLHLASPSSLRAGWTLRMPPDATVLDAGVPVTAEPSPAPAAYTVRAGDGPWDVADALLGDGSRYQEVLDANVGREVSPGVTWGKDQRVIHPGWVFRSPSSESETGPAPAAAEAAVVVEVQPGDTLSALIEAHGDGPVSAGEIAAVAERNDGTATSDGVFVFDASNPDLIHPGQEFSIPVAASSTDPAEQEPPHRPDRDGTSRRDARQDGPVDAERAHPAPTSGERRHRPGDRSPPERTPPSPSDSPPSQPATPVTAPTTAPGTTTAASPAPVGENPGIRPSRGEQSPVPAPIGVGAVLLSTGLLAMLEMSRRRRLRATRTRDRLGSPTDQAAAAERSLRSIGEPERLLRVDVAVRAAGQAMLASPSRIAAVMASTSGDITVVTDGPVELDHPWESIAPTATRWVLPGDVDVTVVSDDARKIAAPCAVLVPIGVAPDGADVLVDLEAAGVLHIGADDETATAVLTALAAGVASSIFAESAHLIGVGLAPGSFLEHPNQHAVDTVDEALELAIEHVGTPPPNADSTFALRARHTSGENWDPAVVLVGAGHDDDVAGRVPEPGTVLVAVGGESAAGWTLRPGDEFWVLEPLAIELTPLGLTPDEMIGIDELIRWVPAPANEESGRNGHAQEVAANHAFANEHEQTEVGEPEQTEVGEPEQAEGGEPEPGWDLMVRLFGLIEVVDGDGRPAQFTKSKSLELLAWLATHRDRATRAGARAALWEIDVRDATFANVVSEARRALGQVIAPHAGTDWIGRTLTAALPLHERVLTDADLVDLRYCRAQRQDGAEAIATLRSAVELIRGVPFAETGYLWPDAEGVTSHLVVLATTCTCDLAERELDAGNLDGVFRATGVGLRVLPGHEELIGLRMRAHAARGDRAGVRQEWTAYERVLVADPWSDGEPAAKLVALRRDLLSV
jgi:nucleoid-associated protein YgaU